MKWLKNDLEKYGQAKEYIDTLLIPLIPFRMADTREAEKSAQQAEGISIIANEIEKELTGRVLLAPPFHYLQTGDRTLEVRRVNEWAAEMKEQPFEHIFLLTFDSSWKKLEKELDSSLIWIPALQLENFHTADSRSMIREQVGQITGLIRSYWQ